MLGEMERNSSLLIPFPSLTLCEGSRGSLHKVPGARLQSSGVSGPSQTWPSPQDPRHHTALTPAGTGATAPDSSSVPRPQEGLSQTPPSILFTSHIKVSSAARFQRQHEQLRTAAGKAGGMATDSSDPRPRASRLEELLQPRMLPNVATLGRGLVLPISQENLRVR